MSIRLRRRRRRRSDAVAERFALSPLDQSPSDVPPAMWLPPLRPELPEDAPVGISMGAFKPQREMERAFWPGPPGYAEAERWEPWQPDLAHPAPRRLRIRSAAVGLAGVLVVAGGAAVPLML